MNPHRPRPFKRRGFLAAIARSAVTLAIAAFAIWQEIKRRGLEGDPDCVKLSACADCVEFGRCGKPKARQARARLSA